MRAGSRCLSAVDHRCRRHPDSARRRGARRCAELLHPAEHHRLGGVGVPRYDRGRGRGHVEHRADTALVHSRPRTGRSPASRVDATARTSVRDSRGYVGRQRRTLHRAQLRRRDRESSWRPLLVSFLAALQRPGVGLLLTMNIIRPILAAATHASERLVAAPGVFARLMLLWLLCSALPCAVIVALVVVRSNGWLIPRDSVGGDRRTGGGARRGPARGCRR